MQELTNVLVTKINYGKSMPNIAKTIFNLLNMTGTLSDARDFEDSHADISVLGDDLLLVHTTTDIAEDHMILHTFIRVAEKWKFVGGYNIRVLGTEFKDYIYPAVITNNLIGLVKPMADSEISRILGAVKIDSEGDITATDINLCSCPK